MRIQDATGQGPGAKVGATNRLYTFAIAENFEEFSNKEGDAYNINTGTITLTDAVDTPILYLKNNEDKDLIVTALAIGAGPSTGAATDANAVITVVRNPTAGTIVSGATAVDMNQNRNFGSSKTLTADAYKGATGNTMTDGDDIIQLYQSENSRLFATLNIIIPKSKSVGIKFDPAASNTSQDVYAAVICHLDETL